MKLIAVLAFAGAAAAHYGKPPCAADEQAFQISGVKGDVCAPSCAKGKCPSDVPKGVTAKTECALSDPLGNKYCVLECTSDKECDQAGGAKCDLVQPPKGVCVYKNQQDDLGLPQVTYSAEKEADISAYKSVTQVTCPKSCSTCQCKGCKNVTVPLGKCTAAGQGAGVIGSCNGAGTKFTEEIFFNEKCQGQSATRSVINTDACIQTSETHQYCAYFCMSEASPEQVIV
jgi:hypothetical protein